MGHIRPFHVMALLARARELEAAGRSVVHMEIGEPDFPTAPAIVAAGRAALEAGHTHYTPAAGLPALREAIAAFYGRRYGVTVAPGRVIVTPGASGALQLVLAALVNPGQAVMLTDPGYPCNRNFVHLVDGEPVAVPLDAAGGYRLRPEPAAAAWVQGAAALLVASPANPTGSVLSAGDLEGLFAVAEQRGARLVVDEIYHGLTYRAPSPTAAAVSDRVFVVNSFSKYFGMTGWRLGWVVAPPEYVEALERLAQNLFLSAPTPAQHAALAAFTPDAVEVLEARRRAFEERRDYLLPALRDLGFDIPYTPEGAFYLYADCSRLATDSFAFAGELLEQAGVAITPGIDFEIGSPRRHVRFAYTTSLEQLEEGVDRLAAHLA
ncbi:MAG TPA: pyridoxal phosphate-dependent aminotransferase [Gammaproteobacteria bacterium]|nr:pyridoxal phosphate-dependent aminotransferase [Gammaproteobacteria bacterium]